MTGIPNDAFLCAMFAGACNRPAWYVTEAKIPVGSHGDLEPLYWLVCDSLVCVLAAQFHAEQWGTHVDTRGLTLAEAEDITGLLAVTAA